MKLKNFMCKNADMVLNTYSRIPWLKNFLCDQIEKGDTYCVFINVVLIRPCWIFQNLISLQLALVVMFLIKWWSNQRAIQFISCFEVHGTYKFITRVLSTQAGPILKFVNKWLLWEKKRKCQVSTTEMFKFMLLEKW